MTYGRHGVRQLRSGWADGPAYITQCPIQPGQNYVYNFTLNSQRGTLLWHAHISWIRATVHGAIVILPKLGVPYPFPRPHKQKIIILGELGFLLITNVLTIELCFICCLLLYLGEWWKSDVEAMVNKSTQLGQPPNVSDAHTINGHPGHVPGCAAKGDQINT